MIIPPAKNLKSVIRRVVPKRLRDLMNQWMGNSTTYSGPYPDWAAALAMSTGYDDAAILRKVAAANRVVLLGDAAFERDSIIFPVALEPINLIRVLNRCPQWPDGLRVLDFGGSLGSLYHQAKPFLGGVKINQWLVCEQPHYVAAGRKEFAHGPLLFVETPEEAREFGRIDLIVASGVLPYLPEPTRILRKLAALSAGMIFIDRTPMKMDSNLSSCVVQHVARTIYPASYPVWLLPSSEYEQALSGYHIDSFWEASDPPIDIGEIHAIPMGALFISGCRQEMTRKIRR